MASIFTIFIHDISLEFFKKLENAGVEVTLRPSKEDMAETYHYTSSLYIRTLAIFLFSKKFTINEQDSKPEVVEESESVRIPKITHINIQNIPFESLERLKQAGFEIQHDGDSYSITIDDVKLCFEGMTKESKEG